MKKWIILFMAMLVLAQLATAICCEKGKDCIISESCQDIACGICSIRIMNRDGSMNITTKTMTNIDNLVYTYNASKILNKYDTFPYIINCTNNRSCYGDCQLEVKDYCGRTDDMATGIALFLLVFNVGVFLLPIFIKKFSDSKAGDYMIRKMVIIAGIIFLWFNSLIFRELALQFSLGIDSYLKLYWWIFTIAMFLIIFIMVYVMVVGSIKLAQETKLKRRMGDEA
jgi:hypothetical protein